MSQQEIIYDFSQEKNHKLLLERNICFEEIIIAIRNGGLLDVMNHPNQEKYPNQKLYVVLVDRYTYLVPFVKKDNDTIFLKTIIPSRKAKNLYLGDIAHD